jgi:2-polyprenyl-3-methyl-5-hydroxy-6-metoxy-1,4-benzoquinol methylase
MVCYIIYNREVGVQAQADEWIVSRRPEDIEAANRNWIFIDKLPRLTFSPTEVQDDNAFEKLLLQTAPLAAMLADFLCKGDHIDAKECRWYHRIWQYLSIMDLVSSPRRHAKFYLEELPVNLFNKQESARILVSGTADYAILVYLLRAFKGRILPRITVLDMCQTPLHLCRWYGVQQGVQIETLVQNILDLERPESFDLITTHDFLTIFDGEERLKILKKWYSLLVSGGRVVTTIRIEEDGTSNRKVTATSNQIKEFMQRATQLTKLWYEFVLSRPDPDWIVHGARIYAEKISSWPFHDSQEILSLFSDAGFKIAKFDPIESQVEMKLVTFIQLVAYK